MNIETLDMKCSILDDGTIEITKYNGKCGNVVVPSSIDGKKVTSIGKNAFSGCKKLTNIIIPDSVKNINENAFVGCNKLTSITIPDSATSIGRAAFYDCLSLISITIPNSVTSIGDNAFEWCVNLKNITIPNGVTNIGSSAFDHCSSLISITIPNSVINIGDFAFHECVNLTCINVEPENENYLSENGVLYNRSKTTLICYPNEKKNTSFSIPNGVTNICKYAFEECESLTSVTIPNSVTNIDDLAFECCCNLAAIDVEMGNVKFSSENGVLYNYDKTTLIRYPAGKEQTSFTISNNVITVGNYAFYSCEKIESITILNSVKNIGDSAFEWCIKLNNISIPDSVTNIGDKAFGYSYGIYEYCNDSVNWHWHEKKPDFKISCYSGTAGENYAKFNRFDYKLK